MQDERRPLALVIVREQARMPTLSPSCDRPVMHIQLNGEAFELPEDETVAGLIGRLDLAGRRVAVELNLDIVTRRQHATTALREGDRVEVVHAIGGG